MLTAIDETLLHQTSLPMAYAGVSDHRFYDRYCFGGISGDASMGLFAGMGCYKNMNVMDGYIAIHHGLKQHNLRVSRVLDPDVGTTSVGPLSIQITEPFRRLRLATDRNESGIACDLNWTTRFGAHLEGRYVVEVGRTLCQDSTRYDQCGGWSGWIEVAGQRHQVDDWWGFRDHSWGVRPGVGSFEPNRGGHTDDPEKLFSSRVRLLIWSCFSTEEYSCQFQYHEDAAGNPKFSDGSLVYRDDIDKPALKVTRIEHDIDFLPLGRAYRSARYRVTLSNDEVLDVAVEPVLRTWAFGGMGYDGSYNDRRGLGAQRGNGLIEHDVFDLADLEEVLDLKGQPAFGGHREQPGRAVINGKPGWGHFPALLKK
jgi:hypothetical protein